LALRAIGGATTIDRGLVAYFPAPHSFTGEACAEFQVHGSPAGVRALLRALTVDAGVRLAEAGEFTRRAFENGKLDLTAVEGLGDLLVAETERQRAQALRRLDGALTRQVERWRDQLLDLRAEIEAQLDFSDEGDVADELPTGFAKMAADLRDDLDAALAGLETGRIVRDGLRVALAGAPNAGKSSLLNALAKSEIAIVTDEPGTTRDVRETPIDLDGQLITLVDLAGLRETTSLAEAEGVRRARAELEAADLVLWLRAPGDSLEPPVDLGSHLVWQIGTKADLGHDDDGWAETQLSVVALDGLTALRRRLADYAAEAGRGGEGALLNRERDRLAVLAARDAVARCIAELERPEVAAELLREASHALERLVGRLDPERVLDRLFASFCIGK
jgi:tRNA modification GTPase